MWWGSIKNSLFLALIFFCSCKRHEERGAILYVASSLLPLKTTIERGAKKPLELKFLNSAAIAQQISQGAPCDAVVVADQEWSAFLLEKNLVRPDVKIFATNALVVASNKAIPNAAPIKDLFASQEKIILADPSFVPLGRYSKAALEKLGMFHFLKTRLILAHSAQMAVLLLEQGAANFALLFRSDIDNKKIFAVAPIASELHPPILYPFLVCQGAQAGHAREITAVLMSKTVQARLKEKGFSHEF